MKKSSNSNLMSGLKNTAPSGVDKSMSIPKGNSINSDTTRGGVAPTPKSIGGRCA